LIFAVLPAVVVIVGCNHKDDLSRLMRFGGSRRFANARSRFARVLIVP
jgi:hypothetical protein